MELPAPLRHAIDEALEGVSVAALSEASRRLTQFYRSDTRTGALGLDDSAVRAYLAVRLPATYAALRASLGAVAQAAPDFAPSTQFDAGAGPGTAFFAARDCWPSLQNATLAEQSRAMRMLGEQLTEQAGGKPVHWLAVDLASMSDLGGPFDLVTAAYVVNELAPDAARRVIERLWSATLGVLVVVEPGSPGGWDRILAVREHLISLGAHILAPCPHALKCPLQVPDWCHFARRVARSRLHRLAKEADVPWEDEKFIYLAASRRPPTLAASRVLAPPRRGSGQVALKLCRPDGRAVQRLVTRRESEDFRTARRLDWGDAWPGEIEQDGSG